jgi:hypothetical protein
LSLSIDISLQRQKGKERKAKAKNQEADDRKMMHRLLLQKYKNNGENFDDIKNRIK